MIAHTKRKWSSNDLQFLRDNAGKMHAHKLADALKRSERAVTGMAHRLGVSVAFQFRRWSREDDALLLQMRAEGVPGRVQAERLGRAYTAVLGRPYDMWLKENKHREGNADA